MKTCSKCGHLKEIAEFSKDTRLRDGLRSQCKECTKKTTAKWAAANPEAQKKYRAENSEKEKARHAKYRADNPVKIRTATAKWSAANPDKVKAKGAKWSAENTEKRKVSTAKYRASNPEKTKAAVAKWRTENPEKRRIYVQNRRARKISDGGKLSHGLAERLFKLQRGKCACCKLPLGDDYHMDHIMPIALGGSNTNENIQLLRQRCNNQKCAKHPVDFMRQRGFLL